MEGFYRGRRKTRFRLPNHRGFSGMLLRLGGGKGMVYQKQPRCDGYLDLGRLVSSLPRRVGTQGSVAVLYSVRLSPLSLWFGPM